MKSLKYIFYSLFIISVIYSCANRGQGPQGGPKDEIPPKMIKSNPIINSLNVKKDVIEIEFDENINLKDISKNVLISPPQRTNPEIRSYGKKIVVSFKDSLQKNTTYSISFSDAIVDNNEGNILKDFNFSFATGNSIDTMQIAGVVINSEDLNPMKGILIGIHNNVSDSAFLTKTFNRINKSGDEGKFTIYNVKDSIYRVFALDDLNRDYMYQLGEGAAYLDTVYKTKLEHFLKQDTIWKDSITIDTIKTIQSIRYFPNDVVLKYFKDDTKRQYLAKSERLQPNKFSIFFNTKNEKAPIIKPLNFNWNNKIIEQTNQTLDSLTYWIADTTLVKQDTLTLSIDYLKTDSLFQLMPQTDTLHLAMRKAAKVATAANKEKEKFLTLKTNMGGNFDVYNPINIKFTTPVSSIDTTKIHFSQLKDSILIPQKFEIESADSSKMNFRINHKWIPEATYQLSIDSATITDIFGLHNEKLKNELRVRSLEDYSSLKIFLEQFDSTAMLQVLTKDEKIIRTKRAEQKGTLIEHLEPGDYYLRLFLDLNGNDKWDTGSILKKRQPEPVYYYNKKLTLIKNWEFEETWNHTAVPLLLQKPTELKKTIEPKANN